MALVQTLLRLRRGDLSMMVVAALLAFAIAPGTVPGAALSPQQAEAVLIWLQTEASLNQQEIAAASPPAKVRRVHSSGVFEPRLVLQAPRPTPVLLPHEAAFLSGVRTNVRRN